MANGQLDEAQTLVQHKHVLQPKQECQHWILPRALPVIRWHYLLGLGVDQEDLRHAAWVDSDAGTSLEHLVGCRSRRVNSTKPKTGAISESTLCKGEH